MTNFEKVVEFNKAFGVIEAVKVGGFDNEKTIESAMNLIREEVRELEEAVSEKDFYQTADALSDILYVVYGMGARIGLNMDEIFNIVHENNMEKLCATEEEAQKTVEKYSRQNIETAYRQVSNKFAVYNVKTNKVLKSCMWKEIDWSKYI